MSILGLSQTDLAHVLKHVTGWETLRSSKILLTGGTGFIGKWLLGSFLHANRSFDLKACAIVLSRDVPAFQAQHPDLRHAPDVEWLQGNVRDFSVRAPVYCSHVIHAATDVALARTPADVLGDSVLGTANVLQIARAMQSSRVLLLSSGSVYGRIPETLEKIPEEWMGAPDCLEPSSAYGEGKRCLELLGATAAHESGLHVSIARCFAFVGPHLPMDKHFAIGNFITAALLGQPVRIRGNGTPLRSYLYASDLAIWLWSLLFHGPKARAYNVGGNESLSIAQLAQRVVKILNSQSTVQIEQGARLGDPVQKYVPSLERANRELGLQQTIDLDSAILRTAEWCSSRIP